MRILITGASGGIGRECVRQFAGTNEHEIIAVSRSKDLLLKLKEECMQQYGHEIEVVVEDFHKPEFQHRISNVVEKKWGRLDALINNAGLLINKSFSEMNLIDIREQMHINFEAPLLLIQSLMPCLKKSDNNSHVVNISSMGGYQGSAKFPGLSVYSSSKAALATLTECLAEEYKEEGVVFNALALGSADTEMLRKAFPGYKSPMSAGKMAEFIVDFTLKGHEYFNGKVLPVAGLST